MAKVNGATLMARNLKQQGVEYMFGIVGSPVQPIASAALDEAMAFDGPAGVNVGIYPDAGRKPQQFGWLTT